MSDNIVIGIEGLVGSGKSSICTELLNFIPSSIVFHAGDLYRAIVYKLKKENLDLNKIDIREFIYKYNINIKIENRETVLFFGDEKIDKSILQSAENSMNVSEVSNIAKNDNAYKFVAKVIDNFKEKYNVIFSGRDTYRIYPNLDFHVFIIADLDERVRRKSIQYNNEISFQEMKKHIERRDMLQRKSGYYDTTENTITIDVTKAKSAKEGAELVFNKIKEKYILKV